MIKKLVFVLMFLLLAIHLAKAGEPSSGTASIERDQGDVSFGEGGNGNVHPDFLYW